MRGMGKVAALALEQVGNHLAAVGQAHHRLTRLEPTELFPAHQRLVEVVEVAIQIDVEHGFHKHVHLGLGDDVLVHLGDALRSDHRGEATTSAHRCQGMKGVQQPLVGVHAQVGGLGLWQPVFGLIQEDQAGAGSSPSGVRETVSSSSSTTTQMLLPICSAVCQLRRS